MGDITKELEDRMAIMQGEVDILQRQRNEIDKKLQDMAMQLSAVRTVYEGEIKHFGGKGISIGRFAGMGVVEALGIIKAEQPNITRQQAHEILIKEGFDFRGKKSKRVVNFGWMALERREKKRSKS